MSDRLPAVTGDELLRALSKIGYEKIRQRGSHVQVARHLPNGLVSTFPVPLHGSHAIKPGTLRTILRLAGLSGDELRRLL